MIRQFVVTCAAACVSAGCAEILGIKDLPEVDASTPAADARSPAADARTPMADAGMSDSITCIPEEGLSFCYGPGYPQFEYEGVYPEDTPCDGMFGISQRLFVSYQSSTITLTYFYHENCGSFARIENAPASCIAVLERSADDRMSWAWVGEIVEPGLNYAYTQIGNNLDRRWSRAVLACDGEVIERTGWY